MRELKGVRGIFQKLVSLTPMTRMSLLVVLNVCLVGNIQAGVKVFGSVWSSGEIAAGKTVFFNYDNKTDSVRTNSLGLFEANLAVNVKEGVITVQTINCIKDTVSKFLYYSSVSDVFVVSIENCKVKNHIVASCQVFYQDKPARGVLVEFSLNNFKSIIGEALTGVDGKTERPIMIGSNVSGILSSRVMNTEGEYTYTSNSFNADDTVSMALFKCKFPEKTLVSGQAKRNNINLLRNEAELLLYEYNPNDNQIYLVDSCKTLSGGGYSFFLKDSGYYLIKSSPLDPKNGILPGYTNGSLFWDKDEVVYASNKLQGILSKNILVNQYFKQNGSTMLSGMLRIEDGQKLSRRTPFIYLLDSNKKAIDYTHVQPNGSFKFDEVPVGNYLVWMDEPGRKTEPLSVLVHSPNDTIQLTDLVVDAESIHPDVVSYTQINDLQTSTLIYPNPFSDFLRIYSEGIVEIDIISINGSTLMSQEVSYGEVVNTSELPEGVYTVMINLNNQITTQRLIKMK
ncbi:MAG: T9SS type A sorting domain-containing protein [Salibacteraceae bacterium]